MFELERVKQQSPETTDSPAVKCKRLRSDFRVATEKKRLQPDPCENKDTFWMGNTCSHTMLAYVVNINNLRTKCNLHTFV